MSVAFQLESVMGSLPPHRRSFAEGLVSYARRYGRLSARQTQCVEDLLRQARKPREAETAPTNIGDLAPILSMFDRAAKNLKYPAIVLNVPDTSVHVRLTIAGPNAKVPGSVTVTDERHGVDGRRPWYGRVLRDGTFECSSKMDGAVAASLKGQLSLFARNPQAVLAEYGRLTGRCSFCRHKLTTEESTTVGFGPVCAERYGLLANWKSGVPING